MIIINQKSLADVVHDPALRQHLTAALEAPGYRALQGLREYMVNNQLAVKSSGERLRDPWPIVKEVTAE